MAVNASPAGMRARHPKNFFERRADHLGIHSYPCACIGICCCVRDANNDAAIVRSSLGVRCLFAAVPFAARRMIERCRRRCPGRLKCHPPRAHQLFDEQPSIGGYLRTEPRRSRIEAPTNCGRFAPSLWAHSSQNRYRCMRMDRCGCQDCSRVAESDLKLFCAAARALPSPAPPCSASGGLTIP